MFENFKSDLQEALQSCIWQLFHLQPEQTHSKTEKGTLGVMNSLICTKTWGGLP